MSQCRIRTEDYESVIGTKYLELKKKLLTIHANR